MKIQLKRSNQLDGGSAKAPSIGYMEYGELAVNFNEADPCIFIKASDGAGNDSIVRIAGAGAESGGLPNGGTDERPGAPSIGDLFFDTDLNLIVYWDGNQWVPVSPGVIISDSKPTESLYSAGTLWYNSDETEGALYILYEDPAGPGANAGGKVWVQIAGGVGDFVSKTDTASQNIASDVTIGTDKITLDATTGSATFAADVTINTVTVGLGGGSVANNTAVGRNALHNNTTGVQNTALGQSALYDNLTGSYNTAVGLNALRLNTEGSNNTALGYAALRDNTEGNSNTAVGWSALSKNITGSDNTAIGLNALNNNTEGNSNTALGQGTLFRNTTGSGNIGIGGRNSAGTLAPVFDLTTEDNRIVMGSTSVTDAYIKVAWNVTSDERDKTSFAPVPHGLDFVKQLQPTAYQFKAGSRNLRDPETGELIPFTAADELPSGPVRYGFKAQDILALEGDNPVIIDNEDPDHLRYRGESLVPVLVNAIQEQQVLIDDLTARLAALEAVQS